MQVDGGRCRSLNEGFVEAKAGVLMQGDSGVGALFDNIQPFWLHFAVFGSFWHLWKVLALLATFGHFKHFLIQNLFQAGFAHFW